MVLLCPGSINSRAKRWPAERFAELARRLAGVGTRCVVTGSEAERELVEEIARASASAPWIGLPLREWAASLAAASLVVTNDSGTSHVAAAVGAPVLTIFGSTDPGWTAPRAAAHREIWLHLKCSPCFQRECPLRHLRCLREITPERVLAEALAMLGHPVPA